MFSITGQGLGYPAATGNNSSLAAFCALSFQFQQWVRLEAELRKTLKGVLNPVAIDCIEEHPRSAVNLLFANHFLGCKEGCQVVN